MRSIKLVPVLSIAIAILLAACGSSSKSSSSAASQAAGTAASSTSTSSSAASGPYGQSSTRAAPTATQTALITTKHDKLGTILAFGAKKLTVYLFEGDKGKSSSCNGACAAAWPPVTGSPHAVDGAMATQLGTIKRADGSTQVTYHGHPLYLFVKDKDDGDTYGEGVKAFGAEWYVLAPSGTKVDKS